MQVPQFRSFVDISDYDYLKQVFERNYIADGPCCKDFLDRIKEIAGAPHGVLASNGTLALYLALKALGIGPGDEVIVQNVSFIASANAIEMVGATPVFVDIPHPHDLTVDLNRVEITSRTKGIMIAHLFGSACTNIEEVQKFCRDKGLFLIEDASQALAITNGTTHCGMFGDMGTFSFYADKTITTGEGGLVITPHEEAWDKMLYLRNQGRKSSGTFLHPQIGYNFRMTDMQGALGLSQLDKLETIKKRKAEIAKWYRKYLDTKVSFMKLHPDFNYIPFRVIAFVENAEKTMAHMKEHNIEPRTMFVPFHMQPSYKDSDSVRADFPNSETCFAQGMCLPTWIGLTEEMIAYTCEKLIEAL